MDRYEGLAHRYRQMTVDDPSREEFFRKLFIDNGVEQVLDCACGTGKDLLMFRSMGLQVSGSDISDSMLAIAGDMVAGENILVEKVDFLNLGRHYGSGRFDAVVCLGNAINEPLEKDDALHALLSMKEILRTGGILVFDQGQTDAIMKDPPAFHAMENTRDISRLLVMEYDGDIQTVHVLDFIHGEDECDFQHSAIRIRIRLVASWTGILREAGFSSFRLLGGWDSNPYDKRTSTRLIGVAVK